VAGPRHSGTQENLPSPSRSPNPYLQTSVFLTAEKNALTPKKGSMGIRKKLLWRSAVIATNTIELSSLQPYPSDQKAGRLDLGH
jgi:hypothetical protein